MAEKKSIVVVFFNKPTEAFFGLSEEEKQEYTDRLTKKGEELGRRDIVFCDCRWSNEEWMWFGVCEWPDLEALQEWTKFIEEQDHFKYIESKTCLGTRTEL